MGATPENVRSLRPSFGFSDDGKRFRTDWIQARFAGVSFPRVNHGPCASLDRMRSRVYVFSPSSFVRSTFPNANSVLWTTGNPAVKPYSLRWRTGLGADWAKNDFAFQAPFCR